MRTLFHPFRSFCGSARGSVVEFVLIFPFLFFVMVWLIDAGNLFANYRYAQQVAESVVRTARSLDAQLDTNTARPLDDKSITILRNVAGRMETQAPTGVNYVWIGRFVRPQNGASGVAPLQMLPDGVGGAMNQGIVLAGDAVHAANANVEAANAIAATIAPGEVIYVVDVTFSRALLTPVPERRLVFSVRYSL